MDWVKHLRLIEVKQVEASADSVEEVKFVLGVASFQDMAVIVKLLEVMWVRVL
jgi:hypothetical protein